VSKEIVFFDGVCNLCNGFVDFLLKHDKHNRYQIASLQGKSAQKLLPDFYTKELSSIVFYQDQKIYTRAEAVLRIVSGLGSFWSLFKIFRFFPFKDCCYRLIAKNRYRFFGRRASCRVAGPKERARFLP